MELGLKGKVAIITGSSRGLGKASAFALAEEGCQVVICSRGEETLNQAVAEAEGKGYKVLGIVADVAQADDAQDLVDKTVSTFGKVDILVNSVGGRVRGDDDDAWRQSFDFTFLTAARCTRLVVPHMQKEGSGSIVHIGSIWGRESGGVPLYNAMKAAMISHAKAMSTELAADGIRVNSVAPGSISHPGGSWWRRQQDDPEGMAKFVSQNIPMGRFGTAEEVGNVVTFLCSGRASWVTGACVVVDGGQGYSNI